MLRSLVMKNLKKWWKSDTDQAPVHESEGLMEGNAVVPSSEDPTIWKVKCTTNFFCEGWTREAFCVLPNAEVWGFAISWN
ncbi:hypothetical protein Acr_18g0000400 [Actinidia rufa]|uniref:Uncharacterized protein n=1 Tax=Actinidia rufa TaxID=165716 RepID=A0A7J0G502_9ERIC|nr:hypothetical protein Acr_18g0000400 [Actinidia rufa]